MPSSGYTAIVFTANEQPTTAKWNLIGSNDSAFNLGTGLEDNVILTRHILLNNVTAPKLSVDAIKLLTQRQTALIGSITTTATTVATLTNVPVPLGGRDLELELIAPQITSSVSGDRINMQFLEGATVLENYYLGLPQNGIGGTFKTVVPAPSSGNHTYTVKLQRDSGTGTVQIYADAIGSTIIFTAKLI